MLCSPSVDRISSFPVRVAGNDIYAQLPATGPLPSRVPPKLPPVSGGDGRHFVIIGAGPAGLAAVETLRKRGFGGRITVLAKEPHLPYDRTKLSKNMAVGAGPVCLVMFYI